MSLPTSVREKKSSCDFNLPGIDWCGGGGHPLTIPPLERSFLDVFDLLGLTQWIREPTYPRSSNTLDLILTSDLDRVGHVAVLPPLPGCDHCPTLIDYVFSDTPHSPGSDIPQHRSWYRGNYKAIREKLECKAWDPLQTLTASEGL